MSWSDNDYPRTRAQAEAEDRADERREYIREHACHERRDCDSAYDETERCDDCGDHYCETHLYNGLCARCFAVDDAADQLLEREFSEKRAA